MNDDAPKPPEKTTTQLPAVPDYAAEILKTVRDGFAHQDDRMAKVEASVDLLVDEGRATNKRLTSLEIWKDEMADRMKQNSTRVRAESQQNLEQDAAIAKLLTKVDELADRPDTAAAVLSKLEAMTEKPWAKKLGATLLPVILLAISAIGIRLQLAVTKLEEKPPTTTVQVQPAPTVYVQVPADGGAR